jgi:hypothetical protein
MSRRIVVRDCEAGEWRVAEELSDQRLVDMLSIRIGSADTSDGQGLHAVLDESGTPVGLSWSAESARSFIGGREGYTVVLAEVRSVPTE